jgi:hypothetical protein
MAKTSGKKQKNQKLKFEEAARELGCDESEAHFDAALNKVARHKKTVSPNKGKEATQASAQRRERE